MTRTTFKVFQPDGVVRVYVCAPSLKKPIWHSNYHTAFPGSREMSNRQLDEYYERLKRLFYWKN